MRRKPDATRDVAGEALQATPAARPASGASHPGCSSVLSDMYRSEVKGDGEGWLWAYLLAVGTGLLVGVGSLAVVLL